MRNRKKRLRNLFKSFGNTHGFWPRLWIVTKILALILWRICLLAIALYIGVYVIVWGIVGVILYIFAEAINDNCNRQQRTIYIRNRYWW